MRLVIRLLLCNKVSRQRITGVVAALISVATDKLSESNEKKQHGKNAQRHESGTIGMLMRVCLVRERFGGADVTPS